MLTLAMTGRDFVGLQPSNSGNNLREHLIMWELKWTLEGKPGLSVQESQMFKDYGRNQRSL